MSQITAAITYYHSSDLCVWVMTSSTIILFSILLDFFFVLRVLQCSEMKILYGAHKLHSLQRIVQLKSLFKWSRVSESRPMAVRSFTSFMRRHIVAMPFCLMWNEIPFSDDINVLLLTIYCKFYSGGLLEVSNFKTVFQRFFFKFIH